MNESDHPGFKFRFLFLPINNDDDYFRERYERNGNLSSSQTRSKGNWEANTIREEALLEQVEKKSRFR